MTPGEGEAVALLNYVCLVGAWWARDPNRLEAKCLRPSSAFWEIGQSVGRMHVSSAFLQGDHSGH